MSLSAGTHLGPYTVVRLLGTGGMGEVYRARDSKLNRDVALKVLFDRGGQVVGTIDQPGAYNFLSISPNGTRAAFSRADPQGNTDLWVHEFARGSSTRLTSDPEVDYAAAWSPDGRLIAWSSRRDRVFNIYRRSSNGTGSDDVVFKSDDSQFVHDWSPDGRSPTGTKS